MMNFSDETVEKVAKAIEDQNWGEPDAYPYMAQAALSSLTLADLMQVEEVRELVEALQEIKVPHEMINRALTGIERASKFSNDAVISNTAFIRGFQKQIGCILSDAEKRIIQPEGEK